MIKRSERLFFKRAPLGRDALPLDPLQESVRSLFAGIYPSRPTTERRGEQRHPFPRLCLLTPVAADGSPVGPAITAAGKHLSETGLSFYHPQPLPFRTVMVALPRPDGGTIDVIVSLDWCRFTRQGWYESGGRFVRSPAPPARPGSGHAFEARA